MTARAVAELCGVELKTVHNWAIEGKLAHFRTPGRHLRFQRAAVETFLRECGYDTTEHQRLRVVCLSPKPGARLRRILATSDCIWVGDLWSALIEVGRAAPHLLLIDGRSGTPARLSEVFRAVKRRVAGVDHVVLADSARNPEHGVSVIGYDQLEALLARRIDT